MSEPLETKEVTTNEVSDRSCANCRYGFHKTVNVFNQNSYSVKHRYGCIRPSAGRMVVAKEYVWGTSEDYYPEEECFSRPDYIISQKKFYELKNECVCWAPRRESTVKEKKLSWFQRFWNFLKGTK